MKTALTELIEWLTIEKKKDPSDQKYNIGLVVAIDFAHKLLEKEREQIVDAWEDGSIPDASDDATLTGEQYYTETFKGE